MLSLEVMTATLLCNLLQNPDKYSQLQHIQMCCGVFYTYLG